MDWQVDPDDCCAACPAQVLPVGSYDVYPRPVAGQRFIDGVRHVDAQPACVHPFRCGLPPGLYAQGRPLPDAPAADPSLAEERKPIPGLDWPGVRRALWVPGEGQLEVPDDVEDVEAWLIAMLRTAPPDALYSALGQAEEAALTRFPGVLVVQAMRRVLSVELPRLTQRT